MVLVFTAISISSIHYYFYKGERLRLIELNLEQNATLLLNSDLNLPKSEFSTRGQKLLNDIIGDDRVNMIIAIYSGKGQLLYQNDNAVIFDTPKSLTSFSQWEDLEQKDYFIKYLTLRDTSQDKIVRVGMILNQSLLRWRDLNQRIFIYVGMLLVMIILISFMLSHVLFKPVHQLADEVNNMAEKIERGEFSDLRSWFAILNKKQHRHDEFQKLVASLDRLAKKITETQQLTQKWSAMMAHELKTPMTILKNTIENLVRESKASSKTVESVDSELRKLESIIMDFLEWASLENDNSRPELHVLSLGKKIEELTQSFAAHHPDIEIRSINNLKQDKKIFCNPIHFDQVINNLLTNSMKHGGGKVEVTIDEDFLKIRDNGPGIPESVIENFGKPFNRFKQGPANGQGLGLAWVNTIAKKYQWQVFIEKNHGAVIRLIIPDVNET